MTDRRTISRALEEISRRLEVSESNPFKARAYEKAARAVAGSTGPLEEWIASGAMEKTPGIGKATAGVIRELALTGKSSYLEELRGEQPEGLLDLMRVPGLGAKKIGILHEALGIDSRETLEEAAASGRIASVRGFGPRGQEKILDSLRTLRETGDRWLLPEALDLAETLRRAISKLPEVEAVEVSGSVRRRLETAGEVDLLVVAARPPLAAAAIRRLGLLGGTDLEKEVLRGLGAGEIPVRITLTTWKEAGLQLVLSTGSEEFVRKVEELARERKSGAVGSQKTKEKKSAAAAEKGVFKALGIPFVPPELRETAEAAGRRASSGLVSAKDLRGVFHVHTLYSDGRAPVAEMVDAAAARSWEYVGISDHSQAAYYARGLKVDDLRRQQREIDQAERAQSGIRVFKGTEADILADGEIDYGPGVLASFDFVVASVHSRFGMEKDEMTDRIVRAVRNPFVTFLGHMTGRLLLSRKGYSVEFDRVFDAAAESGVMIEINGSPRRLDLDWRWMKRALDRGVTFSIHPDAHSVEEMKYVEWGCFAARKGGVEPKHVFNTRGLEQVRDHLTKRKLRASKAGRSPA
ncbi:MAG: PHP domain-containing protein [Thermoanaerobaculia bacterium]